MPWTIGTRNVRFGSNAGVIDQATECVAIGSYAGNHTQGTDGIAIGNNAGSREQGDYGVAIGSHAGSTKQHATTVILNASGGPLQSTHEYGTYIKPVRNASANTSLYYNPETHEVVETAIMMKDGGNPGASVVAIRSDPGNGKLVFDFDDGTSSTVDDATVGPVFGPRGPVGLDGFVGATGPSVDSMELTSDGKVHTVLTDKTTYTTGDVRGSKGDRGAGIVSMTPVSGGTALRFIMTNGTVVVVPQAKSKRGDNGPDVTNVVRGDDELTVHYSDDYRVAVPYVLDVPGADGVQGPTGPTGAAGADAVAVGDTGPQGPQGSQGVQGAAGGKGADGPAGPIGESIVGETGATGPAGPNGASMAMPAGSCTSDYLRWSGSAWVAGGEKVRVACGAGTVGQGTSAVAVGKNAGSLSQGIETVAVGQGAAASEQREYSVALGEFCGELMQQQGSVAIGSYAANDDQQKNAVAVGREAGRYHQGGDTVALGASAGEVDQGDNALALGFESGRYNEGFDGIAVGYRAGMTNLGEGSLVIGTRAGMTNCPAQTIVLDASDSATGLNPSIGNAFYARPLRNAVNSNRLYYNPSTYEITYGSSSAQTKTDIADVPEATTEAVLAGLRKLTPSTFRYREGAYYCRRNSSVQEPLDVEYCGLVAEDVLAAAPSLVHVDAAGRPVDIKWNDLTTYVLALQQRNAKTLAAL